MQVTDAMVDAALDAHHAASLAISSDPFEAMRAALAAALAEMWRPIEEAPIWSGEGVPPYIIVTNGHHSGVGYRTTPLYLDDPEFVDEHAEFIEPRVTHFMPLPAPPRGK